MVLITFATLFVVAFLSAFAVGRQYYQSPKWNYVDVFYYPLAAIGVALLFVSNDVPRELFKLNEAIAQQQIKLDELKASKPELKIQRADDLLTSSIETIGVVKQWAEICAKGPSGAEAKCLAVRDLPPYLDSFLNVAHRTYPTYEERLLAVCTAGDTLLDDIHRSGAISSLVADKLLEQYALATQLKLGPLDYEAASAQVVQFRERAKTYGDQIQRMAFPPSSASGQLLADVRAAEIEYAQLIFQGLLPCITAPRSDLSRFANWTTTKQTQEQAVTQLAAEQQRLRRTATGHMTSLWLQLNLWPFMLVGALSLKFAKGVATLRKSRNAT